MIVFPTALMASTAAPPAPTFPTAGLVFHMDMTVYSGSDGDVVTTIPDLSGNGNDATTFGSPQLRTAGPNGLKTLRLVQGSNQRADLPAGANFSAANGAFFCVQRQTHTANGYTYGGQLNTGLLGWDDSGGGFNTCRIYRGGAGATYFGGITTGTIVNTNRVIGLIVASNIATLYVDGVSQGTPQTIGTNVWNRLFCWGNGTTRCFGGDVPEVLIYNNVSLTSQERTDTTSYFGTKFGITV